MNQTKLSKLQKQILIEAYKIHIKNTDFSHKYYWCDYAPPGYTQVAHSVAKALNELDTRLDKQIRYGKTVNESPELEGLVRHLIRKNGLHDTLPNSFRASFSRSMKRLEKRGLIKRIQNGEAEFKTTDISFTDEGIKITRKIINN